MKKNDDLIVNGFIFETIEAADKARNELSGIDVVRGKINMRSPETVLEVYNKLIDKRLCKTPVGYSYLHDLQKFLKNSNIISDDKIREIPIEPVRRNIVKEFEKSENNKNKNNLPDYKSKYKTALFFNLIFGIAVIIVLYLATTGDTVNIINYENQIIDKYEHWEKELTERENAVSEYEKTYGIEP